MAHLIPRLVDCPTERLCATIWRQSLSAGVARSPCSVPSDSACGLRWTGWRHSPTLRERWISEPNIAILYTFCTRQPEKGRKNVDKR